MSVTSTFFGLVGGDFDMRVGENLGVQCHQGNIQNTRRGDNDLVCWITMKNSGQLGGLDTDLW